MSKIKLYMLINFI